MKNEEAITSSNRCFKLVAHKQMLRYAIQLTWKSPQTSHDRNQRSVNTYVDPIEHYCRFVASNLFCNQVSLQLLLTVTVYFKFYSFNCTYITLIKKHTNQGRNIFDNRHNQVVQKMGTKEKGVWFHETNNIVIGTPQTKTPTKERI